MTSTGPPRSLHLLDRNNNAPLSPQPSPRSPPNPRRQSSISYFSTSPSSRRSSLGPHFNSIASPKDTTLDSHNTLPEREPLTLSEKHSDLLHFIAQKEAKCLELRSQLAVHEAELVQLKRKWERIVNRGFLDSPLSPSQISPGNGAVLEGIVEGVQGVGRFIAAGLAIGELSPPPSQPSSSLSSPLRSKHAISQSSNSSSSTYTTKSTRLSQSSTSSVGEDTTFSPEKTRPSEDQILMVYDTGATPTMSPNPAFEHQQQRRKQHTDLSFEPPLISGKLLRRRSRGPDSPNTLPIPEDHFASSSSHSSSSSTSPEEAMEGEKAQATRWKRATINGTGFPPVSSIPGLAAVTLSGAGASSSWVGSVGKKWEELQKGTTFSKNQKRASVLLSDVSQSIASALSSPPLRLSPPPPPPSSFFEPSLSPAPTKTPVSLLDDDGEAHSGLQSSLQVLIPSHIQPPVPKSRAKPKPDPIWQMLEPSVTTRAQPNNIAKSRGPGVVDDEDEWNW